jgi:hypothetical protein
MGSCALLTIFQNIVSLVFFVFLKQSNNRL